MRQVGIPVGLLFALALSASAPSLHPQEAEKAQQTPSAPAQGAAKPQPQPAAQTQTQTITCTANISPEPLSPALADALHLYRTGKFDDAEAAYNAIAAAGGPDAVLAYTGLARVYLKQNKTSDAFDAASKAVALTPGKTPAITAMGEVYFRQGKMALAEQSFLKPLQACDVDARSYLGLSRIDRATSNYNRAKSAVTRAYNLDPDDPEIGRAYIATLSPSELRVLRDALGHEPNEEARNRDTLERRMALLERESGQPVHTCHPTSKVTATQTDLEAMVDGPRRIRGYGLKVKVNGAFARLRLDTGAGGILIDKKIADKAGVRKVAEHASNGIGDKAAATGYIGFADSIQIGDLRFEGCYVNVVERNSVLDDDGLIGGDVFSSYLLDIDFPNMKLKLAQLPPYPDEAPAEAALESQPSAASHLHDRFVAPEMKGYTPMFRFGHALLIPTKVNDSAPMLFLIDTGSSDNAITPAAAKQVTKISRDEDFKVKGINGEVKDVYRANKANLQFAHFKQDRQDLVTFSLDNISNSIGTEVSGILGFRMLVMLDIKIDYRDGLVDFTYSPSATKR
jgi:tetratricopeptide (TPR) repeat protein